MNYPPNQQPLYQTSYVGFYIKVFSDHVEFRDGKGAQSIPMSQIAGVQAAMMGVMRITLQTTDGQTHPIPTTKKREVQQTILQAHARFMNANPPHPAMQPQHQQQPPFPPVQAPARTVPMGTPIDTEINRVKMEIEQRRLQLRQVNANMATVRSHYQQRHMHRGGKLGGVIRDVQRSSKDAQLRKQQPLKERLQREKLALEQRLNELKSLKAQGITHITH